MVMESLPKYEQVILKIFSQKFCCKNDDLL